MQPGLFAFATACAFVGAALYINLVEQPSRLTLDPGASVSEWAGSNRRGSAMLAGLALLSAFAGSLAFAHGTDIRWLVGGIIILLSWPYAYFVMTPVNIWLFDMRQNAPPSAARELVEAWGLLEWGQSVIGLGAALVFAWTLRS